MAKVRRKWSLWAWVDPHFRTICGLVVFAATVWVLTVVAESPEGPFGQTMAAWVQAVGTIGAILFTASEGRRQTREALGREVRDRAAREAAARDQLTTDRRVALAVLTTIPNRLARVEEQLRSSAVHDRAKRLGMISALEALVSQLSSFPMPSLSDVSAIMVFADAHARAAAVAGRVHAVHENWSNISSETKRARQLADEADEIQTVVSEIRDLLASLTRGWGMEQGTAARH